MADFTASTLGLVPTGQGYRRTADLDRLNATVCTSAAELDRVLMQMADALPGMVDTIIRKVLMDLWSELAKTTPKDTGRATAAWIADVQEGEWSPPEGTFDPDSVAAKIPGVIAGLSKSDQYFLFNNVEYILELENGSSQQAPNGFIAVALSRFARELEKAAQELSR